MTAVSGLPDWNKPGSFSAGRDPLGLQAASVRLYTDLLPGLTNVTNRLRYFSFYCWVVRQFELNRHSLDERKWSIFIRRAEAIYALACQIGDGASALGMAGSDWASKHLDIGADFDFTPWTDRPGEDGQYLKARWGNFGQFYVRSMQQMGMLMANEKRIQAVAPGYGQDLAEAFERACPQACALIQEAIDTGRVSRGACVTISEGAHPALLDPTSHETRLLLGYLCGERETDPTALARRATLWNVLNIADRTGIADANAMRRELYIQDHTGVIAEGSVADNLLGWRAYFVNEQCHIALEVLLNALTHLINAAAGSHPNLAAHKLARSVVPMEQNASLSLDKFAGARRLDTLEQEHDLAIRLAEVAGSTANPAPERLADAISLLLSLWRRWGADEKLNGFLAQATAEGRSACGVFRFFEEAADRPADEALAALIRKFVIGNHLLIAGQKLARAGTYTYRFIVDEAGLVDGMPAEYGFTTPRIGNLLVFARDARLLDSAGLTGAGKGILSAGQPL